MYKVIIVDDELLVISNLKNRINWKEQGFEIIGEARNGISAYEKITKLKPDIVFTDIRMAGMSGLELIQKVNELALNIQFVVISGYAEFAYAQKAMNYGALGFCLKPFDENEIISILRNIKTRFDKQRASYETMLLSLMEDDSHDIRILRAEILGKLGFCCDEAKEFTAVVLIGSSGLNLQGEYRNICLKIGRDKYAYIMEFDTGMSNRVLRELQIMCFEKASSDIKGIGFSKVYKSYDSLNKAFEEAYVSAYRFFMNEGCKTCQYSDQNHETFDKILKELHSALIIKDISLIESNLGLLDELFLKEEYYIRHASKVYNMVMNYFNGEHYGSFENILDSYEQLTGLFQNVHEMLLFLKAFSAENEKSKPCLAGEEPGNDTYKRILNYLDTQYFNDISVQSIASRMQINPNYISQLFKKERGETFTEYLTGLRVRHACSMLKSTDLPICEVAEKAGYKDYFHFAKMFKRITGKTPTAYRDSKKNNT